MGKISSAFEKSIGQKKATGKKRPYANRKAAVPGMPTPKMPRMALETAAPPLDAHLVTFSKASSFATEQFRLLKTHLRYGMGDRPPRSIMVTSALPGEGKSFVAANLAISLAQNRKERVLLIDCDLRKPTIQKLFGLKNMPGLSEYLQHNTDIANFLVSTFQEKLTILPAGKPPANPFELLASEEMTDLLKEMKQRFADQYLIIDTPPPTLMAEGSALSRQVDAVLLVVKKGGAGRETISDLIATLDKEKIFGVVFNFFEIPKVSLFGFGKYAKFGKYKSYYK
jgi:exopolysaccharide/PEP-CTERM locus tyrosine autokinase